MSFEDQRIEEDFDLAVIATIEMHILPRLGHSSVPADAIVLLARRLREASRLREVELDFSNGTSSPSMTRIGSNDSDKRETFQLNDYDSQATVFELDGTTLEDVHLPRERFAYWCLDLLFLFCTESSDESIPSISQERRRVAALSLPLLLSRCISVLRTYLADAGIRGHLPFSRYVTHRMTCI